MSFDSLMLEDLNIQLIDGDRGKNYPKQSEFQEKGHCLFLSAKNVTKTGFQFSEKVYISEYRHNRLRSGKLERNDIVLTTRGTIGNVAFYDDSIDDEVVRVNSGMLILRADSSIWNPRFLYFLFTSRIVQEQIASLTSGSAVPQLPAKDLKKFSLPRISMEVQSYIVKVIGDLSDKLAINTQTNQTLEQMAQAIFKSWFVDFDPVKAKMNGEQPEGMDATTASLFPEKLVESELGFIPEGWEVDSLSSVVDVIMGQSPKGTTYNDQNVGTPLVNGPVEFGVYHPVAQKWTTAPTKLSKDMDLIVCVRGSTTGRYVVSDGEYCLGRGVCSVRSDDYPAFANYLFKSQLNNLLILTTGSTFPSWSGPTLKNFKVVVPPKSIIEKYEAIVGNLCSMMAQNTGENESLASLRDTLLPKLLSGEIELDTTINN